MSGEDEEEPAAHETAGVQAAAQNGSAGGAQVGGEEAEGA